ncbi:MAG: hypothetical protein KDC98_11885, partial [Planctomycetes bacterium]|nr:hypothetical protein [Planctomycetota bacterium]
AEAVVLEDLHLPALDVASRPMLFDLLFAVWEHRPRPARESSVLAALRQLLPGEPEVDLLAARVLYVRGDRPAAVGHLRAAVASGATGARCAELLAPVGLTLAEVLRADRAGLS